MTKDALPPLKALAAFQAAAQAQSFQSAARSRAVTPSAISHQVRALEEWLGVTLFLREVRRVTLTKEGRILASALDAGFGRIARAADKIRQQPGRTSLRVSALPHFTQVWLIPRLERFTSLHPDIDVSISTENKVMDLAKGDADIGIRNLREAATGVALRKLLDVRGVAVSAPSLTQGPRGLKRPEDLAKHVLIHVSSRADAWPRWLEAMGCKALKPKGQLSVDTVPAALSAAARGMGVALAMDPLVWEAPEGKSLVKPFGSKGVTESAYYLACARHRVREPAIRAFTDWIVEEMAIFKRSLRQK